MPLSSRQWRFKAGERATALFLNSPPPYEGADAFTTSREWMPLSKPYFTQHSLLRMYFHTGARQVPAAPECLQTTEVDEVMLQWLARDASQKQGGVACGPALVRLHRAMYNSTEAKASASVYEGLNGGKADPRQGVGGANEERTVFARSPTDCVDLRPITAPDGSAWRFPLQPFDYRGCG